MYFSTIILLLTSTISVTICKPSRSPCPNIDNDEPGVRLNISFNKLAYITKLSLGTPPQQFTFDIGSRSQEFWVRSSNCSDYCDIKPQYNSSMSTSYEKDGKTVHATFGNVVGTMDGYLSVDTVSVGNGKIDGVSFGEITNVFGSFYEGTNVSGVLGLGFKPNPPFEFFVDDLLRLTCIKKVTGFYFKRIKPNLDVPYVENAGHLTIGSRFGDKSLYSGDINWIKPVQTPDGDQLLTINGITAGTNVNICGQGCSAVIDTSFQMISLPGTVSFDINQGLGFIPWIGTGFFTDCNRIPNLPNVTINFDGYSVSIPPTDYLIDVPHNQYHGVDHGDDGTDHGYDDGDEPRLCISTFFGSEDKNIILGRPFLYNSYTLFDYDQKKIGFAKFTTDAMKFAE